MWWKYLNASTLAEKPNVLAGPILRKVTPDSVTVWFALKQRGTVTLTVTDPSNNAVLFTGTGQTVSVGQFLHIVAVTASATLIQPKLVPGVVYTYDASFTYATSPSTSDPSIAAATKGALLTYQNSGYTTPSFCLPSASLSSLRILHGSCRKASGDGLDTLAIVDTLIESTVAKADLRPQQLFLNGDQIYADDVAASLLLMLSDAATFLLGWDEQFQTVKQGAIWASDLPPYSRRKVLDDAGFSSDDLDSHLMSLGEYLCMYLFVWSDVLWPPAGQIPAAVDVVEHGKPYVKLPSATLVVPIVGSLRDRRLAKWQESVDADIKHLLNLLAVLPNVRRALANIPTYMIFDDHEVTDDWNMTHDIAVKLYGTAVGPQVVKNALAAYVLCQHCGNVPERFVSPADGSTPTPADNFNALIDAGARTDNWQQAGVNYAALSSTFQSLLGVPTPSGIDLDKGIKHEPNSLTYNYVVEGTAHQVIVTDSRSWRAFPRGGNEAPDLLTPDQFTAQIVKPDGAQDLKGRLLIVVLSTNMPPSPAIRAATAHAALSNALAHNPDIHEAWDLPSIAFDRLVKALSDRVGFAAGQSAKVVILSGDVHFGFASRLHYQAIKRFEENSSPSQHANLVIAQLVASSFKKQTQDTLDIQREGYDYHKPFTRGLIGPHAPEYYVGWNVQPTGQWVATWEDQVVTLRDAGSARLPYPWPLNIEDGIVGIIFPVYPPPSYGKLTGALGAPDYSYQFDYLQISNAGVPSNLASLPVLPPPLQPGSLTKEEKENAAQLYRIASANYRTINRDPNIARHIIGVNNMGDLTFPPPTPTGPFIAQHRLRFWAPDGRQLFADYSVNMETVDNAHAADPNFPQVSP